MDTTEPQQLLPTGGDLEVADIPPGEPFYVPSAYYRDGQQQLDSEVSTEVRTLWDNFVRATELYGSNDIVGVREVAKEVQLLKGRLEEDSAFLEAPYEKSGGDGKGRQGGKETIGDNRPLCNPSGGDANVIARSHIPPPEAPKFGYGKMKWMTYEQMFATSMNLANGILSCFFSASPPPPPSPAPAPVSLHHPAVILHVSNTPSWFLVEQASSRLSFPLVPLYDSLTQEAIKSIYTEVRPKLIFTEPGKVHQVLVGMDEIGWRKDTVVVLCDEAGWGSLDWNEQSCWLGANQGARPREGRRGKLVQDVGEMSGEQCEDNRPEKPTTHDRHQLYQEGELIELLKSVRTSYSLKTLVDIVQPIHNHLGRHLTTLRRLITSGKRVFDATPPFATSFSPLQSTLDTLEGPLLASLPPPSHNTLSSIIYTSGTTGKPKGALLTHGALVAITRGCLTSRLRLISRSSHGLKHISYLPLAHVLERTIIQVGMYLNGKVCCASSGNSKSILEDMRLIKPDVLIVVPRVLERVKAGIVGKVKGISQSAGVVGRCIGGVINKAISAAISSNAQRGKMSNIGARDQVEASPTSMLNETRRFKARIGTGFFQIPRVLRHWEETALNLTIRKATGGNLKLIICGGAYLTPELQQYVRGVLGCDVVLGYGSTELGGAIAIQPDDRLDDIDTIGDPTASMAFRVTTNGELEAKGPSMFSGYLSRDHNTTDDNGSLHQEYNGSMTSDGWFRTGDKVVVERRSFDKSGNVVPTPVFGALDGSQPKADVEGNKDKTGYFSVRMVDRVSSIFKLTNGEFVAPEVLETILTTSPLIEQAMIPPVNLSCVVALIVPSAEAFSCKEDIHDLLEGEIRSVCRGAKLSGFLWPKTFVIVPEFSTENNQLTPTMKLRRKAINAAHKDAINSLVEEAEKLIEKRTEKETSNQK